MKKALLAAAICACALAAPAAYANDDACESLFCMAGMIGIAGSTVAGGCNGPIDDYFEIRVFKRGKFRPSPTAVKRKAYLKQCKGSDAESEFGSNPMIVEMVTGRFGGQYSK